MRRIKAIGIALTAMALGAAPIAIAQGVEIRGMVKDGTGAGIAGVAVKLEKTAFQAISGADGSFTLNDKSSGLDRSRPGAFPARLAASVGQGALWIQMPESGIVQVTAFGMDGKALSLRNLELGAGSHALPLPRIGQGLVFYRVQAHGDEVITRSLILPENGGRKGGAGGTAKAKPGAAESALSKWGANTSSTVTASVESSPAAPATAVAAGFKDILAAGKAGYLTYRATVTNPNATGLEIRMMASAGALKDADGNEYRTVKIGNQTWTAEHWRSTKYADGTAIPLIQDKTAWANRATPAFCYYNGMANPDSIKRFGALYNWHVINTRKLAPEGWRLPTDADWTALQNALIAGGFNFDGTASGNKIGKAMAGMTDWAAAAKVGAIGNDMAKNNKSGFSAAPTGFRDQGGNFTSMGSRCIMHATSNKENTFGYFADLDASSETLRYSDDWMSMGFLVRLVKN